MNGEPAIDATADCVADYSPVIDFDFYVDRRYAEANGDFHVALAKLNEDWMIRGRNEVQQAANRTDLFSSRAMMIPGDDAELENPPAIPIMLDPPEHGLYRKPLMGMFSPQRMARMERTIREHAIQLIEEVVDTGRCDFVKTVSEPLPVMTFLNLMGFDRSQLKLFRTLAIEGSVDPNPEVRIAAFQRVIRIMSDFIDDRLANPHPAPQDLTDELVAIEIDGRPVTPDELKGYCQLLFFAGLDTVVNALAFGMSYLARHPDAQERVRSSDTDMKLVVEELLRLGAPAIPGRYVAQDEVWNGVQLRKGDRALLGLAAANLDANAFAQPMDFDPHRPSITHFTFNSGPHRCIGQHLARIELRVVYEEWFRRVPSFRIDPDQPVLTHAGMVMGVDSLPLVWDIDKDINLREETSNMSPTKRARGQT
jgi:cytochrome P450